MTVLFPKLFFFGEMTTCVHRHPLSAEIMQAD
jgi:hypothetical protein